MQRDIRDTELYREVAGHFRRAHEPAFGRISGAEDVAPSPDGRLIAFTGTKLEKLEGAPGSRICVVDPANGELQEITGGPNDDRLPRWSPDGERLAFLSDRAARGRFQLFLLDRHLGEAVAAPPVEGSVEYHSFASDGRRVLLGVAEPGAERAGGEGSGRIEQDADLPGWVPMVAADDRWRRLHVHDLDVGSIRVASREGLNVWEAVWCGPTRVAAIVSDYPGEDSWYSARLVLIDAESGRERDVYATGRPDRQVGFVAASPSGSCIALVRALSSDRGYLEGDILMIDPATGAITEIDTAGADVSHLSWRDDEHLVYVGLRHLEAVIGEIEAAAEGTVTEVWTGEETVGGRHASAAPVGADAVAAVLDGYDRPPEIALFREGKAETVVSFAHAGTTYLSERAGRLDRVTWRGPDGVEIEGLLAVPDGTGPYPLILHVHGGPIGAFGNRWSMGYAITPLLVSRGYAVLHPNPRGSTGRGQDFQSMVVGDMGGGDAEDLLAGVEAMVQRGIADAARIGVTGGSYGGFMSAWLVTRSDRFAAAAAISPVIDWYSQHWTSNIGFWDRTFLSEDPGPGGAYFERSPVMFADRVRTPTLLTAGTDDRCTPPGQAVEFHQALRERGVETALAIYPGEGHGVRKFPAAIDQAARVVGWFDRFMPPTGRRS